jgi:SAM-dependent methyltransferase
VTDPRTTRIIEYYDERVTEHAESGHSTLFDDNLRTLEIETVQSWLTKADRVLEIFCGNGVSTLEFAAHCKSIVACDLSEKMIASARRSLASRAPLGTNVTFEQRDVLEIDRAYAGRCDTVVSVRGLINLPSRELQEEAMLKVHRLLPRGGKFIFIEGYRNGLNKINELREKFSLKPLSEPWYDNNFEEPRLSQFLSNYFNVKHERSLDIYFLVSRVLYPLACKPSEPEFKHLCNTVARLLVPYASTNEATTLLICRCLEKK